MNLTEICVRRPIFATMLITTLLVLGIASYFELGVDLYPKVDIPTITVQTVLEGASPEEIETEITKPLEEQINTISGIDIMLSTSTEGRSMIYAQFILEKDLDEALNDVRQKVAIAMVQLPEDVENPVIWKMDPDAAPILSILLSGNRNPKEITEIADKTVKRRIQTVNGVGSVNLIGSRMRELQIFLDPKKLYKYDLSVDEVKQAVARQNTEIPAGRLTWDLSERSLRTLGRVKDSEELANLIVADYKGAPVKLKELGRVIDGMEEARSISRVNGKNGVALQIRKQSGANTIDVVDNILERVEEIQKDLPNDINLSIVRDQSRFIKKSIEEVEHHLLLGALFVSLVVFFFMRNIKASLVACIAIPVSIISTFALMRIMDFTINNLTLLALSLCTGIVIDDAIIVLENIYRYVEEKGVSPMRAAIEATDEIFTAVIATTTSLVVIFLPVAFMHGTVGRFFKSFGLTAAFAIGISLFVALTLIPTLTARLFKSSDKDKMKKSSKETWFFSTLDKFYDKVLRWSLNHRIIVLLIALGIILSTPVILKNVKSEFFPYDDMSEYSVILQTPPGSSLDYTSNIALEIEEQIKQLDGIKDVFTSIGGFNSSVTEVSIYLSLVPLEKRKDSQFEIMKKTREIIKKYPGLRPSVQHVGTISSGGSRRTPFNMVIQGPDINKLEEYSTHFINELSKHKGIVDVDTDQSDTSPEVKIHIDREKASDLGINIRNVASTLQTMVGGQKISTFKDKSEQYDVRLRLDEKYRQSIADISSLPIRSASGELIRLDNIATIKEGKSPSQIDHYNMEREIMVVANLDDLALGEAQKIGNKIIEDMHLPSEYKVYPMGLGKMLNETFHNFLIATVLSIIFIYIVLAAQFESFVQPLIIMSSIPLAIPFGLLSLLVFDQSLNIDSMIGLLLLFGIVKKNGILQVDYTNTLIKQGVPVREAVIEADHERFRPILMTTLTIIAGLLPIALGKGDGSAARATMATLVIGGQALCLGITLIVVPVLYTLNEDFKIKRKEFFNWIKEFKAQRI